MTSAPVYDPRDLLDGHRADIQADRGADLGDGCLVVALVAGADQDLADLREAADQADVAQLGLAERPT